MPSINRPNAPNRLPSSDFGDLFIKPRQLRSSDPKSSFSTPSPLSTPANLVTTRRALRVSEGANPYTSSPLGSPAIGTTQRRQLRSERSAFWSESDARSPIQSPNVIKEETISLTSGTSQGGVSTPREARTGFKWTRDFLGGWIEVRVGRPKEPEGGGQEGPPNLRLEECTPPLYTPPLETPPSDTASSASQFPLSDTKTDAKLLDDTGDRSLLPDTTNVPESASTPRSQKEGLYSRTKRVFGLSHSPITPHDETRSRTPTSAVLDKMTSTLRLFPERTLRGPSNATTSTINVSIAAPQKRLNWPNHRLEWSAPSSTRNLMAGAPSTGTPEGGATYIDSDNKKHLTMDLSQPDAPTFLPSEARRINTPPLPSEGNRKSHPRGFFFDYKMPVEGDVAPFPSRASLPRKATEHLKKDDWYKTQLDAIDREIAFRRDEMGPDVPEHLPNSPLCPRNPKHRSGGTGTCPYHGRNKSTPSDTEQTSVPVKTGSLSPVHEDWWLR